MPSAAGPDLKKYMDKRLQIKLNGNRTVTGVLRGFDQFMNLVLDETTEIVRVARARAARPPSHGRHAALSFSPDRRAHGVLMLFCVRRFPRASRTRWGWSSSAAIRS